TWVGFLQSGHTVEQVAADLAASSEYAARFGTDSSYVESLYVKLFGRAASAAEVNGWLCVVGTQGRAAVAQDFLSSAECRGDVVQQLYGFSAPLGVTAAPAVSVASVFPRPLHRTAAPSAAEVSAWVNSGMDLLSIETTLLSSPEFFNNG